MKSLVNLNSKTSHDIQRSAQVKLWSINVHLACLNPLRSITKNIRPAIFSIVWGMLLLGVFASNAIAENQSQSSVGEISKDQQLAKSAPKSSRLDAEPRDLSADRSFETDRRVFTTEGDNWTVELTVTPARPTLADQLKFSLNVRASDELMLNSPECLLDPAEFQLVREVSVSSPTSIEGDASGWQQLRFEFWVTPMAEGYLSLPKLAMPFSYKSDPARKAGVIQSADGEFLVQSRLDQEERALELVPTNAKPIDYLKAKSNSVLYITAACLIFGLLVAICWFAIRRKIVKPAESIEVTASRELEKLDQAQLLANGDGKLYISKVRNIVRWYIEQKTQLAAPELTTQEFLRSIQNDSRLSSELKGHLQEFLEQTDLVQFAGVQATEHLIRETRQSAKQLTQAETWAAFALPHSSNVLNEASADKLTSKSIENSATSEVK